MTPAELLPQVYHELRKLASAKLARESDGHTLDATALVHEAWLKLADASVEWQDRTHFLRTAATALRRILQTSPPRCQTRSCSRSTTL